MAQAFTKELILMTITIYRDAGRFKWIDKEYRGIQRLAKMQSHYQAWSGKARGEANHTSALWWVPLWKTCCLPGPVIVEEQGHYRKSWPRGGRKQPISLFAPWAPAKVSHWPNLTKKQRPTLCLLGHKTEQRRILKIHLVTMDRRKQNTQHILKIKIDRIKRKTSTVESNSFVSRVEDPGQWEGPSLRPWFRTSAVQMQCSCLSSLPGDAELCLCMELFC